MSLGKKYMLVQTWATGGPRPHRVWPASQRPISKKIK